MIPLTDPPIDDRPTRPVVAVSLELMQIDSTVGTVICTCYRTISQQPTVLYCLSLSGRWIDRNKDDRLLGTILLVGEDKHTRRIKEADVGNS